ncbi:MAG TPA: alpha/beta fold hydrolase [Candidatus Acidoferrales bacterium]|nr:alpha/beta fold hydrolase [Candidatus Acidoferrales bacterium]
MDIHQLRSGIFELFEPLENERQYIVYDAARGNLLIDIPQFGARPLRLIEGTGRTALLLATNAARAKEAHRYREALGVRIAAHADDVSVIPGGADVVLSDDEMLRPDVRAVRVKQRGEGATVVLVRKAGNVLICGDLDLASPAAKQLESLEFTAVLSANRSPMWNAGKDTLLLLQRDLPKPSKQFTILLPPPWDRAYRGRLEDKMVHNDKIVPSEDTSPREAGMGQTTLVVSREGRIDQAKRPIATSATASAGGGTPPPAARDGKRPQPFAEDWNAPGTESPPTTIANPAADIVPAEGAHKPVSIGERFHRVAIEDIAGTPYVDFIWGGIDLSPDAREVAFAWSKTGTFEIYSAPIEGDRIFQLTDARERSVSPRWSPDGAQVAFLRDHGGDERFDLWLVDREGEHERNLTNEPKAVHFQIAWSPDGSRIAYTSNANGKNFKIFTIDVATGAKRQLSDGVHDDYQPRWSPDGLRLVFWSRREAVRTNADLFIVPAAGGTATRLDTRGGKDGASTDASFSPDGTQLAFTSDLRGRNEVVIASLDKDAVRKIERLTENIHDESEAAWRPDARGLVYTHNEDAELSLRRVFTASHATHPVADRAGVHYSARVGPDSDLIAYLYSSAREPTDVFVTRERMVTPRRLTRSLPGTVDPGTLVEPAHVRYKGADGREIPALLYVPYAEAVRGAGKPPAVMYVHGGPTAQHLHQWDRAAQWLANSGYVVLAPNIRGSTGYGREYQELNRGDWGGKDLRDVVLGAEWLAKQGIADPKRIGVYGGSYGGFMTLMVLTQAPEVWAAGVSIVGVVSWKTLWETTRGDLKDYLERELGDPTKVPDLYRDRSPLTHVAKIRAPLLLLQGANDPRVPRSEAQLMIDALRKGNKTFEEHIYEGEGHGFRTRENLIDSLRRATEWFDRYLAPRA